MRLFCLKKSYTYLYAVDYTNSEYINKSPVRSLQSSDTHDYVSFLKHVALT